MKRNHALSILAILALAGVANSGAVAQKGGGGSGGSGGTIYFSTTSQMSAMNSDGSGKTALPVGQFSLPSRSLHGGHRWFLQVRDVPGEGTYPSAVVSKTCREIFGISDTGASLQLTSQLDLETNGSVGWLPGDGQISWVARHWVNGVVTEGGVYKAAVVYGSDGSIIGLGAQPAAPAISVGLVTFSDTTEIYYGDLGPDLRSHDWSPNGTQIVYDRSTVQELHIASSTGNQILLMGNGSRAPVWSPDNTLIAFNSSRGIDTIGPSGSGLKNIVKYGSTYGVGTPKWSPTGSQLIYVQVDNYGYGYEADVYRTSSTGGSKTNLTGDINGVNNRVFPVAWR